MTKYGVILAKFLGALVISVFLYLAATDNLTFMKSRLAEIDKKMSELPADWHPWQSVLKTSYASHTYLWFAVPPHESQLIHDPECLMKDLKK